ncbi:hypothetical protein TC41_2628 [Alicyclobacillus acidocaldarius subsp. acidocaldarius Tc-4-1]|uniref:Uncharacterized protein n=1 Tax=Alicyclobacillus acidocaldarius (strain Tc-4-1) TaxID=1048834 RepID=F8II44_ALIAT|nr:hypothetical protein TC41_2628 [Alicyclobacillus acidocaldarius subsp. acidocaldarius Tc-4-1]
MAHCCPAPFYHIPLVGPRRLVAARKRPHTQRDARRVDTLHRIDYDVHKIHRAKAMKERVRPPGRCREPVEGANWSVPRTEVHSGAAW